MLMKSLSHINYLEGCVLPTYACFDLEAHAHIRIFGTLPDYLLTILPLYPQKGHTQFSVV